MSQATLGPSPYRNSNLFSGHYLDERIDNLDEWDCNEEAREALEALQELWEREGSLVSSYKEDELLSSWIDEVLAVLGFGTMAEQTLPGGGGYNDRLLFESDEKRRDAARRNRDGETEAMYGLASAVLEAKQWDSDFTKRFSEQRSYRDASHQIRYYLEHTPERLKWGVLTDGRKWRLYGTKDYATEIYYEVDLPELLESGDLEQFKYFYTFFRPAAFREVAGTSFLDTVWNESETAAQELGEDLQDNVFTALRVLGEGFIHSNDLDIDPDDEHAREELKEQSLVLLYRLMFVLYAESRGLIHPDDPDAQEEFQENFSLDQIRLEIHEDITSGDDYDDYSGYATQIWGQLQDLFGLVDEGKAKLGIPPYNGGLFDEESHEFLADNEVADRYIAEVIHRLGTTEGEDGNPVLADYADLDTRHLGSIYEGLLEHEFRIAGEPYAAVSEDGGQVWKPGTEVSVAEAVETVEKGELYVVNDDGERKATGAYYTPDYVVSYIIEETINPLLDDIKADLEAEGLEPSDTAYFRRFWQQVLDLKVLDPAMGSAHFLTSATGYLTEQVMAVVREQEIQSYDEQELRRTIAKECIYGVDVNGMAVELGKLSMWLETLAADKPLAFLDHHLKAGNSLVGSDISEVLSDDSEGNSGQLTLTQAFARARQQTLEHVMELMADLLAIDNDDLGDIKSMEELYEEIRDDPLYQRLFEIANVHTAEEFGLDVPDGVYEQMAVAIEDADEWAALRGQDWFVSAQTMADEEDFFHWELEFPEVFFGADGERLETAGFDAVVGNPPWVIASESKSVDYLRSVYEYQSGQPDLYRFFLEKCLSLTTRRYSMITPNTWLRIPAGKALREQLITDASLSSVALVPHSAFEGVDANMIVFNLTLRDRQDRIEISSMDTQGAVTKKYDIGYGSVTGDEFRIPTEFGSEREQLIVEKMASDSIRVGEIGRSTVGYQLYHKELHTQEQIDNEVYHSPTAATKSHVPEIRSSSISRYYIDPEPDGYVDISAEFFRIPPEEFRDGERILIREVTGSDGIISARATDQLLFPKSVISLVIDDDSYSEKALTAVLNSSLLSFEFLVEGNKATQDLFPRISSADLAELSISTRMRETVSSEVGARLEEAFDRGVNDYQSALEMAETAMSQTTADLETLNRSLCDHLGTYADGPTLSEIGLSQPPEGSAGSILGETAEQKPNLHVGRASVARVSDNTVEIRLTARYKPDPSKKGRDAYTTTEPLPALRITDLTETEGDLIEAFVPVAVDEAGGFAGFRETATKTNSLIDRLRKLTLPALDDVRDGLESYLETTERAQELEARTERIDDLIDEVVYELYELTDEERAVVREAVEK